MSKITVEIDIDDYLSEESKKQLAEDVFKEELRKGFLEKNPANSKQNTENYERVLINSVYYFLREEIDTLLNIDHKKIILDKVDTILKDKDLAYQIFKKKDFWEKEDSLAIQYIEEGVKENKEYLKSKIKPTIDKYLAEKIDNDYLDDVVIDSIREIIIDKLTKKE